MANTDAAFSLETFEFLCYSRNRELAARELTKLLNTLEVQYGSLSGIRARLGTAAPALRNAALLTRITAALSSLFSDPEFFLSPQGFGQLISWQRWIATLFSASSFGNADHVLRSMNVKGPDAELELTEPSFVKFCLLYTPDSDIPADVQTLWSYNRKLAIVAPQRLHIGGDVGIRRVEKAEFDEAGFGQFQLRIRPFDVHRPQHMVGIAEGAGREQRRDPALP